MTIQELIDKLTALNRPNAIIGIAPDDDSLWSAELTNIVFSDGGGIVEDIVFLLYGLND